MNIKELREKYPFKPYQPAFYGNKLIQVISFPTPDETIMIRETAGDPTTMIEIQASKLKTVVHHLLGVTEEVPADGLGLLVERLGIDETPEIALLFVQACIDSQLDLSLSWDSVRHYLHDVLRRGAPEHRRETVYSFDVEQLCDAVARFVNIHYGN